MTQFEIKDPVLRLTSRVLQLKKRMNAFTGYALLLLLNFANSAPDRRCYPLKDGGSLCFTQPHPAATMSWSSAMEWCRNIGATLPIADSQDHNTIYGNALSYFGLETDTLWLGANSTYDLNDWYWVNGTRFLGSIENKNIPGRTHAYIVQNGSSIKFVAATPWENRYFICQQPLSEILCSSSRSSYWTNGKCYLKYGNWVPWYAHRTTCGQTYLVSYDDMKELHVSGWIANLTSYWVGLRCSWWTWQDTDTGRSYEVINNEFGWRLPNATSAQCLAAHKDIYGSVKWINRDCNRNLWFICQQHVSDTTTSDITTAATADITSTPKSNIDSNSANNGQTVVIGFGLVGGLILVLIVWLSLFTAYVYRKNRDAKYSLIHLQRQSDENSATFSRNSHIDYTHNDESGRLEMQ